jgi:hypothetical protein
LVEMCDPQIAQKTSELVRSASASAAFIWTEDPSRRALVVECGLVGG